MRQRCKGKKWVVPLEKLNEYFITWKDLEGACLGRMFMVASNRVGCVVCGRPWIRATGIPMMAKAVIQNTNIQTLDLIIT